MAAQYDLALIQEDMAALGLRPIDLARRMRPKAAPSSITRFLKGTYASPKMAKRIAGVLARERGESARQPLRRYVLKATA